jgi:DNA-binding MarR family transcriptional regulator
MFNLIKSFPNSSNKNENENKLREDLRLAVLPPCAQKIYSLLKEEQLKPADIRKKTNYSVRTIGTAIKILISVNLIDKYCDLNDFRSFYYKANNSNKF